MPKTIEIDGVEVLADVLQRKFKVEFKLIQEIISNDRKIHLDPMMPESVYPMLRAQSVP
ncbi:hypothetical protein [Candidatus Nitrosocosmicus sp. SS]|jgi:hypothetical protein|uniref:hypothetical protein n=1 Tax=Candidatus Nitrosocosmicus agrestis TaxID=2563600 RepID=UPI0012B64514|nr:hypothetical protein [Candidatus Nitrosocosmicus sp. SS]